MSLRDKIDNDYKNALKSKDKNKISTYRLILSGIKDLDINNRSGPNKKETDDEDIKKLLKKMIKQRSESIEIYKKNNRSDLLEIEQEELNVLSDYLPKQLSETNTEQICIEIIKNSDFFVGNDTGFMHMSAALGVKSIGIFTDSPAYSYSGYSKNIIPIVPEGETVESTSHDTLGKNNISFQKVFEKAKDFLI